MNSEVILKVTDLKTHFDVTKGMFAKKQIVKAVDGVSFEIHKGETFGLVGESGCGKSTLGRTIVKLYEPTAGTIEYKGQDITKLKGKELKEFRKSVQMIFQDPYASLNPRMTVGEIIREPMDIHNIYNSSKEREDRVVELLKIVGLKPDHIRRYPHEFSGGQRQRVCIARALAMNPEIIIADESVSALDVSVRAQIINLLLALQKEFRIAFLFISHDMAVIERVCHRVAVMYLGQIVELGSRRDVFENPLHPYTKRLMSAVPIPDPSRRTMSHTLLTGEIPSPVRSADYEPVVAPLKEVSPGHFVSEGQVANWF